MLSRQEAASLLGMTVSFLEALARRQEGPVFYRLSARRTAYRRGDLLAWLASTRVTPVTPAEPA